MRQYAGFPFLLLTISVFLLNSCSKPLPVESPFSYPFIKPLHLRRQAGKPYGDYRAFYLLTEDFEPTVETVFDIDRIREVLKFASSMSSTYKIPWTHFVDANALAPAFVDGDQALRQACQSMISDLRAMTANADDGQLHLHGPLNPKLVEQLKSQRTLRIPRSVDPSDQPYRQRRSFFFHTFYRAGYRELVSSLAYGRSFLENCLYDGKQSVLAFRPGGWDHGSTSQDTLFYFHALGDAGLTANSGLSAGDFGSRDWRVGNDPGHNLASVIMSDKTLFEVSPTTGAGGYLNPVLPNDLEKLLSGEKDEMRVIVAVYHLGGLQKTKRASDEGTQRSDTELQAEREALERHFQTVADLTAAKILYPVTLRELLAIISEQTNH